MGTNGPAVNDAVARAQAQHLSPTLIIGLGGTGGDILLRIRKKFFEKFGGIDEFPIVSYLWFDTDKNYKDVGAKQFARKVDFSGTEEHLITIADTGAITGNLDKEIYRNIASWWPTGLKIIPHLDDGAGQYRPYSRLGLFYHYSRADSSIRQAILDALGKIQNPASINKVMNSPKLQRLNYAADLDAGKRNVYLVGSLAGGTGSGMFLDMARIVRYLASDAILVGFLATSRFFPHAKPRMHANTYAALLELDYYNSHDFLPNWSNDELFSALRPPLFNYCYLLDTPNAAHLKLGAGADDHRKIYETIAENVFKDFSQGPFAQAKRSARVNVGQFMGTPWSYPPHHLSTSASEQDDRIFRQSFNRHYQSFGLASISVPHDRIITACAHKLAADLILYWKGQGAADTNVATIDQGANLFLESQEALLDTDNILERLDDSGANAEKSSAGGSLLNKVVRFGEKTFDAGRAKPAAERADFIDGEINHFRIEQLTSAPRAQNAGLMMRCIDQNSAKIIDKGTKDIEQRCDRRIDEDKLSVLSTTAFATRVCELLEQQRQKYADRVAQLSEDIQKLESDYSYRISELRSHAIRHNIDFRKNTILSYDMMRLLEVSVGEGATSAEREDSPGLLLAMRQKGIIEKAIDVCNTLVERIRGSKTDKGEFRGGIISRLQELDRSFDSASETLRTDAHYFEEKHNEDLSLVLFERLDVDNIYYPKYVTKETVQNLSDRVRSQLKMTAASVKDSNFLKQEGGSGQITDLCREVFDPIRRDFHIVDMFFNQFGGGEGRDGQPVINDRMASELNRVFSSARVWGEGGMDAAKNYTLEQGQEDLLVGLPSIPQELEASDGERIRRRREAIKQFLQMKVDRRFNFTDIPETSEIIFYNELSGVPLNFYNSMYELRSAYNQMRVNDSSLHLESKDASKFEDFLILTSEETGRLLSAMRCFTQGALFNEIWVKPGEGNKIEFGYTETSRGVDSRPRMGDERSTITFLQMRADVLDKLSRRTSDRYGEIVAQVNSSDDLKRTAGRQRLTAIAAIAVSRMEQLMTGANQGNWRSLPMFSKMEYLVLSDHNDRIHADAQWPEFPAELIVAKRELNSIATRRIDGRYGLRELTPAAIL
jgi:hypothetical protein